MAELVKDPVCNMDVDPDTAAGKSEYQGATYYFCAEGCKQSFDADPKQYLAGEAAAAEAPPAEAPAAGHPAEATAGEAPSKRSGPEEGWWLLCIDFAVAVWQQVLTLRDHLSDNLGITRFVGIPETTVPD